MTKQHIHKIECPNCGILVTTDNSFSRWLRSNDSLPSNQSKDCFVTTDIDYIWSQYKHNGNSLVEHMMLIELKTHQTYHRSLPFSQGKLIGYFDQLFRNERKTPTKELSERANKDVKPLMKLMDWKKNQMQKVCLYGAHVLAFSGTCPDDSDSIWWDRKAISVETLIKILRFEVNPSPDKKYKDRTGDWFRPISNNGKTHHRRHDTQHVGDLFGSHGLN